jgi:hypothetical protein
MIFATSIIKQQTKGSITHLHTNLQLLEKLEIIDYSLLLGVHHANRHHVEEMPPISDHQDEILRAELELAVQKNAHTNGELGGEGDAAQRKADVYAESGILRRVSWDKEGESWKKVRLLSCADFDTEITFNPNKVNKRPECSLPSYVHVKKQQRDLALYLSVDRVRDAFLHENNVSNLDHYLTRT